LSEKADCGLSLRPQTKLGNLKKADANHSAPPISVTVEDSLAVCVWLDRDFDGHYIESQWPITMTHSILAGTLGLLRLPYIRIFSKHLFR
jgi:hypothetical protein